MLALALERNTLVPIASYTSSVSVSLNTSKIKLVLDPIGSGSKSVNTSINADALCEHGLKQGRKIYETRRNLFPKNTFVLRPNFVQSQVACLIFLLLNINFTSIFLHWSWAINYYRFASGYFLSKIKYYHHLFLYKYFNYFIERIGSSFDSFSIHYSVPDSMHYSVSDSSPTRVWIQPPLVCTFCIGMWECFDSLLSFWLDHYSVPDSSPTRVWIQPPLVCMVCMGMWECFDSLLGIWLNHYSVPDSTTTWYLTWPLLCTLLETYSGVNSAPTGMYVLYRNVRMLRLTTRYPTRPLLRCEFSPHWYVRFVLERENASPNIELSSR